MSFLGPIGGCYLSRKQEEKKQSRAMPFLLLVSCQQKTIMALVNISNLTAFVFPSASLRTAVYFLPCLCLNQRVTCSGLLNLHHAVVDSPSLVHVFLAEYFLAVLLNKKMQYRDGSFPLAPLRPSFLPLLRLLR
jgi:hypothetical protein